MNFFNDIQGYDVFTPGVLKNIGVEFTPGNDMMIDQRITSVEKQIAYLNTMLQYLNDEKLKMGLSNNEISNENLGEM
jgi:hypothetical protein